MAMKRSPAFPCRLSLHAIKEILLENIGLERATRFAGDDAERFCQIDLVFDGLDLSRIG